MQEQEMTVSWAFSTPSCLELRRECRVSPARKSKQYSYYFEKTDYERKENSAAERRSRLEQLQPIYFIMEGW